METTARATEEKVGAASASSFFRTGMLTAGVYLLTCLFYVRGPQAYARTARELFAWFAVLSLLVLFWKGYKLVSQAPDALAVRTLVGFAALFAVLAILTVPFHSTDVFGYINRGWQQVHYGQNPYVYTLSEVPGWQQDPMLTEHWIYNPNPYGFLFSLVARGVCQLGGGNWWLTLLLFKVLNGAVYALSGWLVWAGARLMGRDRPVRALYTFLWNPLILMHHLANGHNDILVGCLLALALYLALRRAVLWIVPALVAATLLKYAPALLIPLALIFIVKQKGWKTAIAGCLLGGLILVAVSAPYLKDWELLVARFADIKTNATLIDNSLHSFIIHIFENIARLIPALAQFHDMVDASIKAVLRLGFVLFFALVMWRLPKRLTATVLMEKSLLILFVLICVVSSKFNAWYMGMLLAPVLLLPEQHWLRRLTVLISCAELLSLTFFKQAYIINYFVMILVPTIIVFRQLRDGAATTAIDEEPRPQSLVEAPQQS